MTTEGLKRSLILHGREVPVYFGTAPDAAIARIATESLIFKNWFENIDPEFALEHITITAVDFKHNAPKAENVMFVRLRALTAKSPHEQIVELRGHSTAMLVNLVCSDDNNSVHTVLVCQSRPATGDFRFIEIPAGMVDAGSFRGAAARELEEELGLKFTENELVNLTEMLPKGKGGLYLSPGLLDERCEIYLAERTVTIEAIDAMRGRLTGVAGEGEFIELSIVPFEQLPVWTNDAKSLLAYFLYKMYDR